MNSGLKRALRAIVSLLAFASLVVVSPSASQASDPPRGTMGNPAVVSDAAGELTLSWEMPDPIPVDYRIVWAEESRGWLSWTATNEADRGNEYPAAVVDGAPTVSMTITGLTPGDTYKIRARARYTHDGARERPWSGPWTPILRVTVAEAVEEDDEDAVGGASDEEEAVDGPPAPAAPTVRNIYMEQVIVRWEAPELEDGDDAITAYDVQYKVVDDTAWSDGPQDVTPGLKAEVSGLVPDINYLFRVRAQAGGTEGAWSDATEATTAFWESRLRPTAVDQYDLNRLLGYEPGRRIGWMSNPTISYDGVDYPISTLAKYDTASCCPRYLQGVRHLEALDFHVEDFRMPDDWVLAIEDRLFKLSEADYRAPRPRRRTIDPHVHLTFWLNPRLYFQRDAERDVSLSRDPALSSRGVDDLPEEEEEEPEGGAEGSSDGSDGQARSGESGTAPVQLEARVGHDRVTITWDAPEEGTVVGYRIWRGTDVKSLAVLVEDTGSTDTTYRDTDVEEGTAYVYAVEPIVESTGVQGRSDNTNSMGDMSALVHARTLVQDPSTWNRHADLALRALPMDSSGTQILPVSDSGDGFLHTWANEAHQQYTHYKVDLDPYTVYRVLVWDPDHAEHHVQIRGGPSVVYDFRGDVRRARLTDGTLFDGLSFEEYQLYDDYHFWLTRIRIGAKNGPNLVQPDLSSLTGDLEQLHYIGLGTPLRGYTFQTGPTGGFHYLQITSAAPEVIHQIRIEKAPDYPDQPSKVARISQSARERNRKGWNEGYVWEAIGPAGDQDWFHVQLQKNKRYEFVLETSGDYRNLQDGDIVGLAGPDGNVIESTRSATTRLRYKTAPDGAGDYYIGVRSSRSDGTGMYRLWLRETDVPSDYGTDITLGIGEEYLSFLHDIGDVDTYMVEVEAGRRYRAEIYPWNKQGWPWPGSFSLTYAYALGVGRICSASTCRDERIFDHGPRRSNVEYHENRAEFSTKSDTTLYINVNTDGKGIKVGSYFFRVVDIGADS